MADPSDGWGVGTCVGYKGLAVDFLDQSLICWWQ